ncbi:DsbA family protein [Corynebacterium sp. NPDC060344]|uniref:DsbA family protein n=1 Tax=Corynebacterium sp. NPDC060344 TaxID=3347101 RepID=UPI00365CE545
MSTKIKNPNQKGSGFVVGIIALIAIVAVVIGVVLYMGRNQPIEGLPDEDVSFSVQADGNVVRLASDDAADDAVVAEVFEDYSCRFCAEMAQGGHGDQLKALNDGELVVEYHSLNFLDRSGPAHSTKSIAVMHRIAESGDARLFWNFHTLMMEDIQAASRWEDEDFAERLEAMDAPSDVVEDVRNGLDVDAADKIGKANGEKLNGYIGGVSSPHVIVDGNDVTPKENGTLGDWVKAALDAGRS